MPFTIHDALSPNYVGRTIDASSGEVICNLDAPSTNRLVKLQITKTDLSSNKVIIKYDGATIKELSSLYEGASLVVSGDNWVEV